MKATGFYTTHTERLATGYRSTPDGLLAWDESDGAWSHAPRFGDAASGLVSTAGDLLAFARMLLGGGAPVLSADAVRAMTTDQLTPAQKARGGLGPDFFAGRSWGLGQAVLDTGVFGWDGGLGTSWMVDPGRDLVVIVMTQRMFETPEAPQVHRDIRSAAYAALA
jgi:CubicO group peptidase (beta-lactamase class C family)